MSGQSQLQRDAKTVLAGRGIRNPTPQQVVAEMIRIKHDGGGIEALLRGFAQ